MIYIYNSWEHFIIRNNWFNYTGPAGATTSAGIRTYGVRNGIITNNIFTYTGYGLKFGFVTWNLTISNNIFLSDWTTVGYSRAIELGLECDNNTIINNQIFNSYSAMYVSKSDSNIIEGNYIKDSIKEIIPNSPIWLRKSSYNKVLRNMFAGAYSFTDFSVGFTGTSNGNTVENNSIVINGTSMPLPVVPGISSNTPRLQQSSENTIALTDCSYKTIAHNRIVRDPEDTDDDIADGDKGIPGYNYIVFLGIIGLISLVIIKRNLKRSS